MSDVASPGHRGHASSAEIVGPRVRCPRDMYRWERSEAMADVVAFVRRMNAVARRGPPASPTAAAAGHGDAGVAVVARLLCGVAGWAAQHAPAVADGGGALEAHRCFREFHARLRADGRDLLTRSYAATTLRGDHRVVELAAYLDRSFGDADAAAYGPQHELSFCMFLIALFKLRRLTCADEPYVVPVLFDRYTEIADGLVHRYRLEPSDEYGDAGLDDYRYVGFLWGSAQLAAADDDGGSAHGPAAVIADGRGDGGMFFRCVAAAYRRAADRARALPGRPRPAPVWCHSYQLWNLSACARWSRVNELLMAAFRAQVLDRFRVARRLAFGELLRFAADPRPPVVSFYDCIPAAAAAATTAKEAGYGAEDLGEDDAEDDGEDHDEDGRRLEAMAGGRIAAAAAVGSSRSREAQEEFLFES